MQPGLLPAWTVTSETEHAHRFTLLNSPAKKAANPEKQIQEKQEIASWQKLLANKQKHMHCSPNELQFQTNRKGEAGIKTATEICSTNLCNKNMTGRYSLPAKNESNDDESESLVCSNSFARRWADAPKAFIEGCSEIDMELVLYLADT